MTSVDVWWAPLTLADVRLREVLSPLETARLSELTRPADQARSLLAAALVRAVAGEALGIPPRAVEIDRTCPECGRPHGRPVVVGAPELQLSVSHSGVLVLAARSAQPVGVDVQRNSEAPADQDPMAWVRREAILKSGLPGGAVTFLPLVAPREGYSAGLASAGGTIAATERDAGAVLEPIRR